MINSPEQVRIAIVTALPVEAAAIRLLLTDDASVPGHPQYHLGAMRSTDPSRPHVVVLAPPHDGQLPLAVVGDDLVTRFPAVEIIVSVGVAGGVPTSATPERYVRLGDIVVATGVVDCTTERPLRHVDGLSRDLVRADLQLQTDAVRGLRPWEHWLGRGSWSVPVPYRRPPEDTDGLPRVHRGLLGSGDHAGLDAQTRDRFARVHDIIAFEGSDPPNAAARRGRAWFGVRGVAQYRGSPNDALWRPYGSLAAAAYTRALLSRCDPSLGVHALAVQSPGRPTGLDGLDEIAEALLDILKAIEDTGRRSLLAGLPDDVRTSVPDHPTPRVHVLAIVRTCARYPDGESMLRLAAQAIAPRSPELARLEAALASYWPSSPG